MEKVKQRESNIELLRIVAILLVILSHSVPFYLNQNWISFIDLDAPSVGLENLVMIFFRILGQLGNALFVMCSAYFLMESKRVKISKMMKLILDTTIVSLICFFVVVIQLGFGYKKSELASTFFPTIYRENYWFICCYLLLYMIHPLLNIIINDLSKRKLLLVNIGFITLYSFINMINEKTFFYTELIGFIEIYFIIAYMKKYMDNYCNSLRKNLFNIVLFNILLIINILIINMLGLAIEYYNHKMLYWFIITNPIIIVIASSWLNIFRRIKIESRTINYFASLTMLIYVISDNYFIREKIKPLFFERYYGQYNILFLVFIEFCRMTFLSIIAAILYKGTIKKVTDKISEKFAEFFTKSGRKILDKLQKID